MYHKDHLSMASVYQKQILNENTMPVAIIQTQEPESESYEQEAVEMSVSELESLIKSTVLVLSVIRQGSSIEPWMASKITLASDYINSVAQAISSEQEEDDECECSGGDLPFQADTTRGTGDGTMA
jgi:hypothetical protein